MQIFHAGFESLPLRGHYMADKKPLSKNLLGLLISAGVVFLAPVLGLLSTVLFLRGAFRDTASVDPSEKARFLAEGISDAMNGTALGLAISIVAHPGWNDGDFPSEQSIRGCPRSPRCDTVGVLGLRLRAPAPPNAAPPRGGRD